MAKKAKDVSIITILSFLLFVSCKSKKTELVWSQSLHRVGTQSSPKTADLNGDGILDIIIGAGIAEIGTTKQGITAMDGLTGKVLWQAKTNASMVGSATLYDFTKDGINDIIIGGRNHNLKALNGQTGELIWEYSYQYDNHPILKHARFNFYNSVLVPDQNQDDIPDLLTVNGGNWNAAPNSTIDRYPGVLMLFDLKNGEILAADTMPDGKESYMTPICFTEPNSNQLNILFGTGGETIGGSLYLSTLEDLQQNNLKNARTIATEQDHGFIAPPVLADINEDGQLDIIAINHAAIVLAIDGANKQQLWRKTFVGMESSNSFAVGYFNKDDTPDFFTTICQGTWPDYKGATAVLLDGTDGNILYEQNLGCMGLSSAVVYDLTRDGIDEAILSVNNYDCRYEYSEDKPSPSTINNQLMVIDFQKMTTKVIDQSEGFRNIYSTPWIGDLDQDDYLDIIFCQNYNPQDLYRSLGMRVKRISTAIPIDKEVIWGSYLGTNGDGKFVTKE